MSQFTVIDRTHGACRDCDDAQRKAVEYAINNNLNGATGAIQTMTAKGSVRQHNVHVKRGR